MGRLYNLSAKLLEYVQATIGDADKAREFAEGVLMYKDGSLTSAQILALNTTPVSAIAAPGAGKVLVAVGGYATLDYNSATYSAGSDLLKLSYTDASGDVALQFTNAFVEAAADARAYADMEAECVPVVNAPLVFNMAADPTTGDSLIYYRIYYRVLPSLLNS